MVEVNHMYAYTKKIKWKQKVVIVLSLCVLGLGGYALTLPTSEPSAPVFQSQSKLPIIKLPSQSFQLPFRVQAQQQSAFFDGNQQELSSVVEFEGVYRANQGIDYGYENQEFDIYPISKGKVLKVYEDELLGSCITIQHDEYEVTYASLSNIKVKSGQQVVTNQKIAQAGKNTYRKDLGNHLYIVVEKDNVLINPLQLLSK